MSRFYIFIIILFFSLTQLNAQSTDGFWGLKYGMTKTQVEAAHIKATIEFSNKDAIYMKNVSFGGIRFDLGLLSFYKNQLYTGYFTATFPAMKAASVCVDLTKILIEKYGLPKSSDDQLTHTWINENDNITILNIKPDENNPTITLIYSYEKIRLQKEHDESLDF